MTTSALGFNLTLIPLLFGLDGQRIRYNAYIDHISPS